MGLFDAVLDLTMGESVGNLYRLKKSIKQAGEQIEAAEYAQYMNEERRHQELLDAIRGRDNDDSE